MEHGVSVMRYPIRSYLRFLLMWCTLAGAQAQAAEQGLVLVASTQSPINTLPLQEARKVYLGVPMRLGDKTIQPLRNASDPLLVEVFMQHVMFMASETYERQILNRVFRLGGERPPNFYDNRALATALQTNPWAISYMWRDTARTTPGIKIVAE